jgi:hypothetical protein
MIFEHADLFAAQQALRWAANPQAFRSRFQRLRAVGKAEQIIPKKTIGHRFHKSTARSWVSLHDDEGDLVIDHSVENMTLVDHRNDRVDGEPPRAWRRSAQAL